MTSLKQFSNYFTNDVVLKYDEMSSYILRKDYKRLENGFSHVFNGHDGVSIVTVHRGFLSNGFSFPYLAKMIIERTIGLDNPAVVIHDYLYENLLIEKGLKITTTTHEENDSLFLELIKNCKEISNREKLFLSIILGLNTMFLMSTKPYSDPFKRHIEVNSYHY